MAKQQKIFRMPDRFVISDLMFGEKRPTEKGLEKSISKPPERHFAGYDISKRHHSVSARRFECAPQDVGLIVDEYQIVDKHIDILQGKMPNRIFQSILPPSVVRIQQRYPIAGCHCDARIARATGPGIMFKRHRLDSIIGKRKFLSQCSAGIGRTVIDDYQFPIFIALSHDAFDRASKIGLRIETWHND
ncbi:MAG: hypothetical protein PSY12_06460 [bacterium]|nr:hypothetical protein [bacterium]